MGWVVTEAARRPLHHAAAALRSRLPAPRQTLFTPNRSSRTCTGTNRRRRSRRSTAPAASPPGTASAPVADAARNVLREEAGVTVPGAAFVAFCLTALPGGARAAELGHLPRRRAPRVGVGRRPADRHRRHRRRRAAGAARHRLRPFAERGCAAGALRRARPGAPLPLHGPFTPRSPPPYDLEYDDRRALAEPLPDQGPRRDRVAHLRRPHPRGRLGANRPQHPPRDRCPPRPPRRWSTPRRSSRWRARSAWGSRRASRGRSRTKAVSSCATRWLSGERSLPGGDPVYEGCWLGEVKPRESVLLNFTPIMLTEAALSEGELPFAAERSTAAGLRDEAPLRRGAGPAAGVAVCRRRGPRLRRQARDPGWWR